jgi:hypothetical protein
MKKIFIVMLLFFLGNIAMAIPVQLPPDTRPSSPNLTSPLSTSPSNTPTYTWDLVPGAYWYYLRVEEKNVGVKISQWYSSSGANCTSSTGSCSITPSVELPNGSEIGWAMYAATNYLYSDWTFPSYFTINHTKKLKNPILISPHSVTSDMTPTYEWEAVMDAAWYLLWVNDKTGNTIHFWYRASEANCNNGKNMCSITPTKVLKRGKVTWWVQAYNRYGYGKWSQAKVFSANNTKGFASLPIFSPTPIIP